MKIYTAQGWGLPSTSFTTCHIYQFQGQNLPHENHRVHAEVIVFVMPTCPPFEKVKLLDPKKQFDLFSDVMTRWLVLPWVFFDWFNNHWISAPGTVSWTAHIVMPIHTAWAFTQQKSNEIESEMGTGFRNSMKGQTPPMSYVLALLVHHNALFGVFQLVRCIDPETFNSKLNFVRAFTG